MARGQQRRGFVAEQYYGGYSHHHGHWHENATLVLPEHDGLPGLPHSCCQFCPWPEDSPVEREFYVSIDRESRQPTAYVKPDGYFESSHRRSGYFALCAPVSIDRFKRIARRTFSFVPGCELCGVSSARWDGHNH